MKSISYAEMQKWKEEGKNFQLIDVREQDEFDEFNIGGHLLPMNTVPDHVEAFSREIPVVVHCKAGSRSATVIRFLEEQYGFGNLYNLEGGVLAVR
jgi:rhodanese-related sulfurtransferase